MTTSPNPCRGFRFLAEVIEHAVWLYHCLSLSLRDVGTILAARSVVVSYESIREWSLRFGRLFAHSRIHNHFQLRRHRLTADQHRAARDDAFRTWREVAGVASAA